MATTFACTFTAYHDIPKVSDVTPQQVLDNYYQVKMDIKRLIGKEVERLKAVKDVIA